MESLKPRLTKLLLYLHFVLSPVLQSTVCLGDSKWPHLSIPLWYTCLHACAQHKLNIPLLPTTERPQPTHTHLAPPPRWALDRFAAHLDDIQKVFSLPLSQCPWRAAQQLGVSATPISWVSITKPLFSPPFCSLLQLLLLSPWKWCCNDSNEWLRVTSMDCGSHSTTHREVYLSRHENTSCTEPGTGALPLQHRPEAAMAMPQGRRMDERTSISFLTSLFQGQITSPWQLSVPQLPPFV